MNINNNRESFLNRISILPYETKQQHTILDAEDRFDGEERTYYAKRFNSTRKNHRSNSQTGKTVLQIVVEQRERINREKRNLARIDIEKLKNCARKSAMFEMQRDETSRENTKLDEHENANTSVSGNINKRNCDELFAKFDDFFQKLAELKIDMESNVVEDQSKKPQKRVSWRLDLNECVLIDQLGKTAAGI